MTNIYQFEFPMLVHPINDKSMCQTSYSKPFVITALVIKKNKTQTTNDNQTGRNLWVINFLIYPSFVIMLLIIPKPLKKRNGTTISWPKYELILKKRLLKMLSSHSAYWLKCLMNTNNTNKPFIDVV